MTFGWSLVPETISLEDFGKLIISLIVLTVILHSVIAAIFEGRKRKGELARDERDIEIERKGAHYGYRFMQFFIGVIIFGIFMSNGWVSQFNSGFVMQTPVQIIYYLIFISYIADLIKHAVMIHAYRT